MAKICSFCGRKLIQKIESYSSGDGCLSLTWRYVLNTCCPRSAKQALLASSPGRKVTKRDAERYLTSKEGKHLADRNWLPVFINQRWVLARHVKRIGPSRLRISGHSYDYKIDTTVYKFSRVEEANLITTFKVRRNWKTSDFPMLNGSIRMVIRFFLNHGEELQPFFKNHKVIKGEV